eukprot:1139897-Pelagomonas_calceolata.AAC.5
MELDNCVHEGPCKVLRFLGGEGPHCARKHTQATEYCEDQKHRHCFSWAWSLAGSRCSVFWAYNDTWVPAVCSTGTALPKYAAVVLWAQGALRGWSKL